MLSRRSLMQGLAAAALASWPLKPSKAEGESVEPAEVALSTFAEPPGKTCTCPAMQWDLPATGDSGPARPVGPPGPSGHRGLVGPASPESAIFSQLTSWLTAEDEVMLQRHYGIIIEPAIRRILPSFVYFSSPGYSSSQVLARTMKVVPIGSTVKATVATLRDATLQGITAAGARTPNGHVTAPVAFYGYNVGRLSEDRILLVWYEYADLLCDRLLQHVAPHLALCSCRLKATLLHHDMSNERDRERYLTDAGFRKQVQRLADC